MAIEKEFKVKLEAEISGFESGIGKANGLLGGLGTATKLAEVGVAAVSAALRPLIERGLAVEELSNAFDNLYGKTSALANDGLGKLRVATQGLVGDFERMKKANIAAQAEQKWPIAGLSCAVRCAENTELISSGVIARLQSR